MKWYCCINELGLHDPDICRMLWVALMSCRRNTRLVPHLLYSGGEHENLERLRKAGFNILKHTLSIEDDLVKYYGKKYPRFCGHWLRIDIPDINAEDEYVLYTDIDVMFLRDIPVESIKPKLIACSPEHYLDDFSYFNSGSMVINVPACREVMPAFRQLVRDRIKQGEMQPDDHDQVNLNLFFKNRWDVLPGEYNWKPYWGANEQAAIVHFHGPKPSFAKLLLNPDSSKRFTSDLKVFCHRNPGGYEHFLNIYDSFSAYIERIQTLFDEDILTSEEDADRIDGQADASLPIPFREWFIASDMGAFGSNACRPRSKPRASLGLYYPEDRSILISRSPDDLSEIALSLQYDDSGAQLLFGDWDGDGLYGIGLYERETGSFVLCDSMGSLKYRFRFGPAGMDWIPLAGDWNGDGRHTVGLYDPVQGVFYLSNGSSDSEVVSFQFGPANAGWIPLAGDWDGDGLFSIGLYNPVNGSFYLRNRLEGGGADMVLQFGPENSGMTPLAGDWDGFGYCSVALYDNATGIFHVRDGSALKGGKPIRFGSISATAIPLSLVWTWGIGKF
jgi:hypothetical protein